MFIVRGGSEGQAWGGGGGGGGGRGGIEEGRGGAPLNAPLLHAMTKRASAPERVEL